MQMDPDICNIITFWEYISKELISRGIHVSAGVPFLTTDKICRRFPAKSSTITQKATVVFNVFQASHHLLWPLYTYPRIDPRSNSKDVFHPPT